MKKWTNVLVKILLCAVAEFLLFWFMLPPINIRSKEFWTFFIISVIMCSLVFAFSNLFVMFKGASSGKKTSPKKFFSGLSLSAKVLVISILSLILITVVATLTGAEFFNASRYNRLLTMTDGDFSADVAEISRDQIPVVDRDTASRLGQRKLGEMSDLVSQFEIMEDYTQINYGGKPVRVTPLAYGDVIKWFNNQKQGIPAYIMVDMTTQDTTLVRLDKGMKYSESEYFMRNIYRYLRFKYPTKIFDDISFEIDEEGTPYFVASTVKYRIGVWSGADIDGAILVNAVTGESKFYSLEEIPTWVDQVFSSDMIINQLIYNGKYRSGFLNSIFGQKGVLQPTDGYNYLAINDDVYLYTGITSVTSDESNVGFVLVNLRTKETKYYAIPGAEEYSAMSSAEGQVQHLSYRSTFPLLLNVADRPSYFMSLKDGAGLVKMYAFVDVQQYQVVGTGNSVDAARQDYLNKLKQEDINSVPETTDTVSGIIRNIGEAVVDGNTTYYIMLENDNTLYEINIGLLKQLSLAEEGDVLTMEISKNEAIDSITVITAQIEFK